MNDLEHLVREHGPQLRRRLERMTRDRDLAEDLCQEVLLRAWRRAPADAAPEVLQAWLHRTATNVALDELRRHARRGGVHLELPEALAAPESPDAGAAREALAQLSPHERLLLLLRFEAGLSLREVAAVLAISEEAARKRVSRARQRFSSVFRAMAERRDPVVLLLVRDEDPVPYERWLADAGAVVRRVDHGAGGRDVLHADGLVITGAYTDIDPRLYGMERRADLQGEQDLEADRRDLDLLRGALQSGLPIIGVCSGHQLLNIASGGTLLQDLDEHGTAVVDGHEGNHAIRHTTGSLASGVLGRRMAVHSSHHQAVAKLGSHLRVSALSDDGVVEGIERTDHPFAVGLQWKPQLVPDAPASTRLAEAFVEQAARVAA
ncbi:sigma-70 family RNA polymerase sigma factor [Conexibacter sp. SYSU D00693]|uniref:sigma-70 family RNA polymerase sigma factor n=1 Tax=Conexibacter sp. SYSU D00693 TaxID=2812560 RepID=UPI00196A2924|nr:sigma-70 family RNA polymerase sigma factor [Conexibacter sp. SYSU D00693]